MPCEPTAPCTALWAAHLPQAWSLQQSCSQLRGSEVCRWLSDLLREVGPAPRPSCRWPAALVEAPLRPVSMSVRPSPMPPSAFLCESLVVGLEANLSYMQGDSF